MNMNLDDLEFKVNDGGNNVDITAIDPSASGFNIIGTASANVHIRDDNTNKMVWWISRIKLFPNVPTGNGIGSMLLEKLKNEMRKRDCCLIVCPGGYAENRDEQFNFYIKNGFEYIDNDKYALEWDPNWKHRISNIPNQKRLKLLTGE